MLLVVGAGDAVGTHERTPLDFQTDHHELAIFETQPLVAGGLEAEQGVVPVVDTDDALAHQVAHAMTPCRKRPSGPVALHSRQAQNIC
ncbi:hypothetical protein D3C77_705590 [compost metagenome]